MTSKWEKEEIKVLLAYYSDKDAEFLKAKIPNKTYHQIQVKANHLGLKKETASYSEEEISFIRLNYSKLKSGKIGEVLGRSSKAINSKARLLGLEKQFKWTSGEIATLKKYFGVITVEEISETILPGRSAYSIHHKSIELGLQKTQPSYESISDDALLKKLAVFYSVHGRTPFKEELGVKELPSYFVFVKRFGDYSTACKKVGIPVNKGYLNTDKCLSKNGDVCFSRAEKKITDFMIDNGILFEKEILYSSIFNDASLGTIRSDWVLKDGSIVEYFGLEKKEKYREKMKVKIAICKRHNRNLIQVFERDLNKLEKIFLNYL